MKTLLVAVLVCAQVLSAFAGAVPTSVPTNIIPTPVLPTCIPYSEPSNITCDDLYCIYSSQCVTVPSSATITNYQIDNCMVALADCQVIERTLDEARCFYDIRSFMGWLTFSFESGCAYGSCPNLAGVDASCMPKSKSNLDLRGPALHDLYSEFTNHSLTHYCESPFIICAGELAFDHSWTICNNNRFVGEFVETSYWGIGSNENGLGVGCPDTSLSIYRSPFGCSPCMVSQYDTELNWYYSVPLEDSLPMCINGALSTINLRASDVVALGPFSCESLLAPLVGLPNLQFISFADNFGCVYLTPDFLSVLSGTNIKGITFFTMVPQNLYGLTAITSLTYINIQIPDPSFYPDPYVIGGMDALNGTTLPLSFLQFTNVTLNCNPDFLMYLPRKLLHLHLSNVQFMLPQLEAVWNFAYEYPFMNSLKLDFDLDPSTPLLQIYPCSRYMSTYHTRLPFSQTSLTLQSVFPIESCGTRAQMWKSLVLDSIQVAESMQPYHLSFADDSTFILKRSAITKLPIIAVDVGTLNLVYVESSTLTGMIDDTICAAKLCIINGPSFDALGQTGVCAASMGCNCYLATHIIASPAFLPQCSPP
jgi:hypothetical protein